MSRGKEYKAFHKLLYEKIGAIIPVYLSSGLIDFGDSTVAGFADFDSPAKKLNISLPQEAVIIFPTDGAVTYRYLRPAIERLSIMIITRNEASLYAEAIACILKSEVVQIENNFNVISQLGFLPLTELPNFSGSNYSVAALYSEIQYTPLQELKLTCMDLCCQSHTNLPCMERCDAIEIPNLTPNTEYKVYVQVPHSSTSGFPVAYTTDALGVLSIPISTSFSGMYHIRAYENGGSMYDCFSVIVNP